MSSMQAAPRVRARPKRVLAPWRDRQGRFSALQTTVLTCAFLPAIVLSYWWATGQFGARPLTEAIHGCGLWAFRFLLISLVVSPARVVFDAPKVLLVRRMLGLTALAYALAHFGFYIADQHFVLMTVVREILRRFYLTIGFVVLVGLAALGATSTDAALRWMGRGWKRLHRTAYALGLLAAFHYFLQTKANVTEAVMFAGFLVWLLLWRLLPDRWQRHPPAYFALAIAAPLATAWIEFAWYAWATRVNPWRLMAANETIAYGLRPAHWVAVVAFGLALLMTARHIWARLRRRGPLVVRRV